MNWNDLRFVLALARERTLSGAAKRLRTAHTTVARRLEAIEADLGVRLFDSEQDGFVPTAMGARVLESAERTEAELLALEARVVGGDAKLEGSLRVTTTDILFRRYEGAFSSFIARYPGIELTLVCTDAEASLQRREADVALRMSSHPPESLVGRRVGRVDFAVYASKKLARSVGLRAPLSEWPWLHWDTRLGADWLDVWLEQHALGARVSLRVAMGSLALREAVASGLGIHFLACVEGDADKRLCRVGPLQRELSRDVWLLTLRDLQSSTRVRAFLDHFAEHARGEFPRAKRGS